MCCMVRKFIWYWLPTVLWLGGIYFLSAQPGLRVSTVNWEDFILRKIAHIGEYFILSFLLFRSFHYGSGVSRKKSLILAFLISFIYAASDEFHQTFVFDRQGRVRDVLIDTAGIFASVIALWSGKFKKIEHLSATIS